MFALKKETDYAVQLLRYLGTKIPKGPPSGKIFVSLREFSEKSGISFWFLQKIARKLNLAGIIEAEQGVKGGYRLQVPKKALSLYRVFEIMEGKMAVPESKMNAKLNKDIIKVLQKVKI